MTRWPKDGRSMIEELGGYVLERLTEGRDIPDVERLAERLEMPDVEQLPIGGGHYGDWMNHG